MCIVYKRKLHIPFSDIKMALEVNDNILKMLLEHGVGQRKMNDKFFEADKIMESSKLRLGVYDQDEENLCHNVIANTCHIPGCKFSSDSLVEYEFHYNSAHRYTCGQCKKILPSPHLLDLHIQEMHDSYFMVMAERKPSYCCFIQECTVKFLVPDERRQHCVEVHKFPKNFYFDKPKDKTSNAAKGKKKTKKQNHDITEMEVTQMESNETTKIQNNDEVQTRSDDVKNYSGYKMKHFSFGHVKAKTFNSSKKKNKTDEGMDYECMVEDLKENLPT